MTKKAGAQGDISSKDPLTLRWTEEMDAIFLDALIEECGKGNIVDGTFTTTAYDNVLKALRSSFGNHLRKDNLKNRLKTLKDHFGACYDLFHGLSGFSWNPMTKMFEAEPEVWEELIKAKPEAKKWMRTPIKHYDKLFEIYSADRAMGKQAESAKEKLKRWENNKETINLNDEDDFIDLEAEWNDGQATPHSASHATGYSAEFGMSNQSGRSHGPSSRGTKRKAPMSEQLELDMDRMSRGIESLTCIMKDGNYYYEKSIEIAEKQAVIAEKQPVTAKRHVEIAHRQLEIAQRQVEIAEKQVHIAEKQAQLAERGIIILEQTKVRQYSETDVWSELDNLGVVSELRMRCYRFLCREERAKREFFGVPFEVRLATLYELMKEVGAL